MGLSNNFPCAAEGVLTVLVMNTVLSVALLRNMLRSVLQVISAISTTSTSTTGSQNFEQDSDQELNINIIAGERFRRVSITQFKSLCPQQNFVSNNNNNNISNGSTSTSVECCVCLSRFEAEEEVSELSCKHFFHKGCLDKWFHDKHMTTCPLCRSIH